MVPLYFTAEIMKTQVFTQFLFQSSQRPWYLCDWPPCHLLQVMSSRSGQKYKTTTFFCEDLQCWSTIQAESSLWSSVSTAHFCSHWKASSYWKSPFFFSWQAPTSSEQWASGRKSKDQKTNSYQRKKCHLFIDFHWAMAVHAHFQTCL